MIINNKEINLTIDTNTSLIETSIIIDKIKSEKHLNTMITIKWKADWQHIMEADPITTIIAHQSAIKSKTSIISKLINFWEKYEEATKNNEVVISELIIKISTIGQINKEINEIKTNKDIMKILKNGKIVKKTNIINKLINIAFSNSFYLAIIKKNNEYEVLTQDKYTIRYADSKEEYEVWFFNRNYNIINTDG